MNTRKHRKDFVYIVLAFVLLGSVIIFFDKLASPQGFIYIMICSFLIVIGISYFINLIIMLATSKDRTRYVLPISCGLISIISLLIGFVLYNSSDAVILENLSSEIIWVFITIPAFVCAIVYLIFLLISRYKDND